MTDPSSPDAVARAMGLGGDLPSAPPAPRDEPAVAVAAAAPATHTGLEVRPGLAWWRRARVRALVVPIVLCFAGYVFTWGDVEEDSRAAAIFVGGFTFGLFVFVPGFLWWSFRHLIGRPRPFGRAVFNYGLVGVVALFGIALADEFLG